MALKTSDFDYPLDPDLIAQAPAERRDASRLMVLHRCGGSVRHHVFTELPDLLCEGDVLVINDTRVIPARFFCRRRTGGKVEGLFCRETQTGCWEVLLKKAGRCKIGEKLQLERADGVDLVLREDMGNGRWNLAVSPPAPAEDILGQVGATPLPPYIRRMDREQDAADRERYQTIYADRPGAVAAPTAGLHFTEELFDGLARRGVETIRVTLHVGLGTFSPVKAERVADHGMHGECYDLSAEAADKLNTARGQGRRIIAVGTTSVRVLETAVTDAGTFEPTCGWTDIFLYPPADFRAVDALITNFHLPRSTLLMLVAAFCSPGKADGLRIILDAYAQACRLRYRFYSYGDAMLIE